MSPYRRCCTGNVRVTTGYYYTEHSEIPHICMCGGRGKHKQNGTYDIGSGGHECMEQEELVVRQYDRRR